MKAESAATNQPTLGPVTVGNRKLRRASTHEGVPRKECRTFLWSLSHPFLPQPTKKARLRRQPGCKTFREASEANYFFSIAAWAAARRAMGTRNGEQLT